ncbi:MAG: recN [Paucimonas sp.]|nr:recN [Paucimonas sp.]
MLRSLSIRDFVIVDTLDIELAPGFTVFTGETGAGKSILVDALALALGGRGDASVVREGAARADISAEFSPPAQALPWLSEQALEGDNGSLLLRRVIDSAGRSKAFINGVAATASQLRELGELLVDIHGQHAHQSLLRPDAQRMLLDQQAGLAPQAVAVAAAYKAWRAVVRQREEFESNARNVLLERERLAWQVGELEKLATKPGEWADVSLEQNRLANAAALIEGTQEALLDISEAESGAMLSRLSALEHKLARLQDIDSGLRPVLELLEPARIQLQEAAYALKDYLDRVDLDPARLAEIDARVDAIHSTARKFRLAPEDLPAEYDRLAQELAQMAQATDMESLRAHEAALQAQYRELASGLSAARAKAAAALARSVTDAMQELSMAGGRLEIALRPCEPASYGLEQVEFLVAGHAGTTPRALQKVASGGELARISLAISVITSGATATPTLIFDEVDSGIGGAVAEVVGRLLKRLGQERQVLCVTHLPQVASQANQHFQVSKDSEGGERTVSRIAPLDGKGRVEEVARMLGGLEITATTRKHARELLAF